MTKQKTKKSTLSLIFFLSRPMTLCAVLSTLNSPCYEEITISFFISIICAIQKMQYLEAEIKPFVIYKYVKLLNI